MGYTTIKVTTDLRDRLANDARSQQQPIGQFLEDLLAGWERQHRMAALARSIRDNPPDDEYWSEFADFDALGGEQERG